MKAPITFLIITALCLTVLAKPNFIIKNNKIYDENGGEVIFHGTNLVIKNPPYYSTEFDEKDL